MQIIKSGVTKIDISEKYLHYFKDMVKAVVDIENKILAVDAELHSDLEELLLKNGSKQENLWGINIYPKADKEKLIEYTSLINIRPSQGNASMDIKSNDLRAQIQKVVNDLII